MSSPEKKVQIQQIVRFIPEETVLKQEVIEIEDEDLNIPCRFCSKVFANELAIKNHVRNIHHFAETHVDINIWVNEAMMKKHANEVKSEPPNVMEQVNVLNFGAEDVEYVIVQPDQVPSNAKRKKTEGTNKTNEIKEYTISGPFECLEPCSSRPEITCHQIFNTCCDYSIHYRDEHTKRRKGVKCQVCEKLLPPTGSDPDLPYRCQPCGWGFGSVGELLGHRATYHSRLKPYSCVVCLNSFTHQGGLQQHMRMHTGDRPYACVHCPKAFTQKSGLDQHLRTHTKEKPYRCIICQKTFSQSVHLLHHMRVHTNVTPFQCKICQKRFKQSSHLNYHLKHHDVVNLTDDQKAKYQEIVGMIIKTDVCVRKVEQIEQSERNGVEQNGDRNGAEQSGERNGVEQKGERNGVEKSGSERNGGEQSGERNGVEQRESESNGGDRDEVKLSGERNDVEQSESTDGNGVKQSEGDRNGVEQI